MKKLSLTTCFILLFFFLSAQPYNPTKLMGTVALDNFSSMDATEITIEEYVYFLIDNYFDTSLFPNSNAISRATKIFFDDLRKQKDFDYIKLTPHHPAMAQHFGSTGFTLTFQYASELGSYQSHFRNFSIYQPVVGITYEQAQKFCRWREAVVNNWKRIKVRITLPTLEAYKIINPNKDSLKNTSRKEDSCMRYAFNYKHDVCTPTKNKLLAESGRGLVRCALYARTKLKLYDIQGNAAEMTSTKGVAVGGSFRHTAKQSLSSEVQHYDKAEDWLGFRCLITLY